MISPWHFKSQQVLCIDRFVNFHGTIVAPRCRTGEIKTHQTTFHGPHHLETFPKQGDASQGSCHRWWRWNQRWGFRPLRTHNDFRVQEMVESLRGIWWSRLWNDLSEYYIYYSSKTQLNIFQCQALLMWEKVEYRKHGISNVWYYIKD